MTAAGCGTKGNDQKVDNPSNVQNPQGTQKPANDEVKQKQEEQAKPPIIDTKPAVPVTTTKPPTTTTKPSTSATTPKPPTTTIKPPETITPKPAPKPPTPVEEVKVAVSDIMKKITQEVELPAMMDLKKEEMKDYYYINPDDVEEYIIKTPMMNVMATEIAIIKVKDVKNVESVKEGINKRVKDLEGIWEQYLPRQYELVKNHVLKSNGQYIILIIHEDAKKIEETFDSFFKK
jgi:hypothetical protein